MLFSEIPSDFAGPRPYAEPPFEYLDRSARVEAGHVRRTLTDWYARYPAGARADLRARFHDTNTVQHVSAAFELYMHEVLSRLGYSCSAHPSPPNGSSRRPDFLADGGAEDSIYVEAVLASARSGP